MRNKAKMDVLRWEFKKLITFPMLWVFFVLCLTFNLLLVFTDYHGTGYGNYVAKTAQQTGVTVDENFYSTLSEINDSDNEYYLWLTEEVNGLEDVFDDYHISTVGKRYIDYLGVEGKIAESIRAKYALMQESVDKKSQTDESLSLYLAGDTYNMHRFITGTLIYWLLIEGILFAILVTLLAVGYENIFKTEYVVYSSKTGRRVVNKKLFAGTVGGLLVFLLLVIITLAVYLKLGNYHNIWHSSVSSGFNYINDLIAGSRPFATWSSFSVLTYLLSIIMLALGLILCFILMAFCVGLFVRNTYRGFLIIVILNTMLVVLPTYISSANLLAYITVLSPVWLYLKIHWWFTDGGAYILWSHFEIRGVIGTLFILVVLTALSQKYFKRRDLL